MPRTPVTTLIAAGLGLLFVGTALPAAGQALPSLADRADAFVEALNSGDADRWYAFATDVQGLTPDGAERLIAMMTTYYLKHRGVVDTTVRQVWAGDVPQVVAVTGRSARREDWFEFQFFLRDTPPYPMRMLFLATAVPPVAAPPGRLDDPDVQAWLDDYLRSLETNEGLSGVVLVARDGRVLFERAYGWADRDAQRPNTPNTRFNLGSGNKMFTAVTIARLAERGLLDVNGRIIDHLPDYPNRAVAEQVTIHQLLTHTSGLGDYWTEAYERSWDSLDTVRDLLPFFVDQPLQFTPGTGFAYSNAGFAVLGLIIEAVTGRDYFEVIRDEIYDPADMGRSDSYRMDGSVPGLAQRYEQRGDLIDDPAHWLPARHGLRGSSAGGGFATARDVLRFDRALYDGTLLGVDALETLTRSHADMGMARSSYGYGLIREDRQGCTLLGHGGQAPGVFFEYARLQGEHCTPYTLILFSNHPGPAAASVDRVLRTLALR